MEFFVCDTCTPECGGAGSMFVHVLICLLIGFPRVHEKQISFNNWGTLQHVYHHSHCDFPSCE